MKLNFGKIILLSTFVAMTLYFLMFIIFPSNSDYYQCNEFFIGKFVFNLDYYIPISCDLEIYMLGVNDFGSIIEFDYNYQTRPLYILYIKTFYEFFKIFVRNNIILNFLSFLIGHILIVSSSIFLFFKSLDLDTKPKKLFLLNIITSLIILNPIIKYGLFDASHQTLTILQFSISFYFLRKKIDSYKSIFIWSLLLGVLSQANMTFMISFIFLIFNKYKKLDFSFRKLSKLVLAILILIAPRTIWNFYITSQGFVPYNAATQYWIQFIWIKDFILAGYENVNYDLQGGEYYCMSIPLFFRCYLIDFLNSLLYLSLPIFVFLINLYLLRSNKKFKNYFKDLIFIFFVLFCFWAFIGWYPPLRFNLYSLGYLITFTLAIQILYLPNKATLFFCISTLFTYYLSLTHWNNLDVIDLNYGVIGSVIMLFIFIFKTYQSDKQSTFS